METKIKNNIKCYYENRFVGSWQSPRFLGLLRLRLVMTFLSTFLPFYLFTSLFTGCGKKSQQTETAKQVQMPKPKIKEYVPPPPPPRYAYKGGTYRDPLIPGGGASSYSSLNVAGEGEETMTGEKMVTLQLKGIFMDEKIGNIAIVSETSGNSYILKNGKLYNKKNKDIKGVTGVIGKKVVTLISSDTKIELKLKKIEEEGE